MTPYAAFLASKQKRCGEHGHHIGPDATHPALHPWQAEIVVLSELESQIADNITRKEREANRTIDGLVTAIQRTRQETAA